jgi:hypothetical protein
VSLSHVQRAERRREMARLVEQGRPPQAVAIDFGVSRGLVYDACTERGVVLPRGLPVAQRTLAIVAELLNTDDTYTVIAARWGRSTERVRQIADAAAAAGIRVVLRPMPKGERQTA